MKRNSETLFHFTKTRETLESILLNGFWPRYCIEDVQWAGDDDASSKNIAMPIVCFCDIPLSRIDEHVLFYGEFGIGMSRAWALRNSLSPLHYIDPDGPLAAAFRDTNTIATDNLPNNERLAFLKNLVYIAMHMKPLAGTMVVHGKPVAKDFYPESEWRHVATGTEFKPFLTPDEFDALETLNSHNSKTRANAMLTFLPNDVRYIFVKSDSEIPSIMNFIQQTLDKYPAADLKVLMSRVTSLESIRSDW